MARQGKAWFRIKRNNGGAEPYSMDDLQPDLVMPCQFYEESEPPDYAERTLWIVMLNQTLAELHHKRQYVRWQAQIWLESNEDYPGSLVWLCEALELDIAKVRAAATSPLLRTGGRRPRVNQAAHDAHADSNRRRSQVGVASAQYRLAFAAPVPASDPDPVV